MRMTGVLVTMALAACTTTEDVTDAGLDAAPPVPADARGIDGPPGACPDTDIGSPSGTALPSGAAGIEWACISGCGLLPRPPLTMTTRLEIAGSTLTWRSGATVVQQSDGSAVGNCWLVPGSDDGCHPAFYVCGTAYGTRVEFASWYDANARWRQVWEMRTPRTAQITGSRR